MPKRHSGFQDRPTTNYRSSPLAGLEGIEPTACRLTAGRSNLVELKALGVTAGFEPANLSVISRTLYQLSYVTIFVAGMLGFEPRNARVKVSCLNQLGYIPTSGGSGQNRTADTLLFRQVLYATELPSQVWWEKLDLHQSSTPSATNLRD